MSTPDQNAHDAQTVKPAHRAGFWLRELPFSAVLLLTLFGVAYTGIARQPMVATGNSWPSSSASSAW